MQKSKLIVIGLIKNENNEFLISERLDPDVPDAHLKWDIPGGTNEFGESLEETLDREIIEETGLNIKILKLIPKSVSKMWKHKDYDMHAIVFCYECLYLNGDIKLNDPKINNLKWASLSELTKYDFLPTTKYFIEMLLNKEI